MCLSIVKNKSKVLNEYERNLGDSLVNFAFWRHRPTSRLSFLVIIVLDVMCKDRFLLLIANNWFWETREGIGNC